MNERALKTLSYAPTIPANLLCAGIVPGINVKTGKQVTEQKATDQAKTAAREDIKSARQRGQKRY